MNAVRLDRSRNVDQVFIDHRNKGDAVARCKLAEELLKGLNVIRAIIRRQRDSGQQNADVRGFESRKKLVEVAARLIERQSAQAVVAAELDDDHLRIQLENRRQAGESILGSGAACAPVENLVVVARGVQVALEEIGVRLAFGKPVTGRDAVSVADEEMRVLRRPRHRGRQKQANSNQQEASNVHKVSVVEREPDLGQRVCSIGLASGPEGHLILR